MKSKSKSKKPVSSIVIGLTGNIATGKSTVAGMLVELGATYIDADRVAHEVMRSGTPTYAEIVAVFGAHILRPDGEIDRRRLGAMVFADAQALARLEAILHPAIIPEVERRITAAATPVVLVEAIKLLEAGMAARYDQVWVTTCSVAQQIERLMRTRGLSATEARLRVEAQPPQEEKIAQADVVIRTDGTLAETRFQVMAAWQALRGLNGFSLEMP